MKLPEVFDGLPEYSASAVSQYEVAGMLYLQSRGYSFTDTCAIMANFFEESRYNPRALRKNDAGKGNDSFGIEQVNRGRLDGLRKFTQSLINKPLDAGTTQELYFAELAYAVHELNTTHITSQQILVDNRGKKNSKLASEFGKKFEGFGADSADRRDATFQRLQTQYSKAKVPAAPVPDNTLAVTQNKFILPKLLWKPSPNVYAGRTSKKDLIVLHDTEGGYAGAVQTFLTQRGARSVSAHFVLNESGTECTQMVRLSDIAWHVAKFNSRAVGIEMSGFIAKGFGAGEWHAAAVMTATIAKELGIPLTWSEHGQAPGICRHYDLGAAGGGHTDPTQDLSVWRNFLSLVKQAGEEKLVSGWAK